MRSEPVRAREKKTVLRRRKKEDIDCCLEREESVNVIEGSQIGEEEEEKWKE